MFVRQSTQHHACAVRVLCAAVQELFGHSDRLTFIFIIFGISIEWLQLSVYTKICLHWAMSINCVFLALDAAVRTAQQTFAIFGQIFTQSFPSSNCWFYYLRSAVSIFQYRSRANKRKLRKGPKNPNQIETASNVHPNLTSDVRTQ